MGDVAGQRPGRAAATGRLRASVAALAGGTDGSPATLLPALHAAASAPAPDLAAAPDRGSPEGDDVVVATLRHTPAG